MSSQVHKMSSKVWWLLPWLLLLIPLNFKWNFLKSDGVSRQPSMGQTTCCYPSYNRRKKPPLPPPRHFKTKDGSLPLFWRISTHKPTLKIIFERQWNQDLSGIWLTVRCFCTGRWRDCETGRHPWPSLNHFALAPRLHPRSAVLHPVHRRLHHGQFDAATQQSHRHGHHQRQPLQRYWWGLYEEARLRAGRNAGQRELCQGEVRHQGPWAEESGGKNHGPPQSGYGVSREISAAGDCHRTGVETPQCGRDLCRVPE